MGTCVAYGCTNRTIKKLENVSFHQFPPDEPRRTEWILAIRRKNWMPTNSSRVCSEHFEDYMIDRSMRKAQLKPNAVPTKFPAILMHHQKICSHPFEETDSIKVANACDPETGKTLTTPLSCSEKKAILAVFPNFNACERPLKEASLAKMKLGEKEQNTSTLPENIHDAVPDSNVPVSERQENERKLPGRPRKRKRGPFRTIHKKEKGIAESSQTNCDEITSSNGSDIKNSVSISLKKKGPFRSIYNEREDASLDSQMNCYEISSSSGSLTDPNVSSSFSSQLLPNVCIKKEKPWEEEYNYFGNSSSYLSRDNSKMQIEINDVRSVPSTGSLSGGKVDINQKKIAGSLTKPLKIEHREEVFGKLVACEMSDLCGNPDLYLKTKQAILNLLVQARFDQMKQNGEIL